MSYSALFTAGLLEHVERSPSPASRSPDNTPTPSRSVTPTRLPAANAPAAAAHLRSFLSIEPESARPESFRTGISRFTRDRSDSCTSSCSTSSSFVESPITESLPSSSSSSLPPVLPPLSPRALSPLSFYEPTPSPKAPAFPRTSTSSPIPRLSTASPASRRRSLPEPKPAPSALLPPSPPPESTIYTRSASIDSRRTSILADLDIPIKSPLFVPLRIQSDPISPTSEDLYSLRTVSTNYKRVQRSDALARLEANAHIRSFFDDDTDASVFSGKTKSTGGYPSVALSIQPRIPGSPLRVESHATTDRRRERKKAEVVLKPVRARETWSKTFLDLGDESVWSYRSRSTPISAL